MPTIRIYADDVDAGLCDLSGALTVGPARGAIVIMIHGYKYQPDHPDHCPWHNIYSDRADAWPSALGFGGGSNAPGLALTFGWPARGPLWAARRRALEAGHALARLIRYLHSAAPARPVHIIAHSLGVEPALEALLHVPEGAVSRIVSMTGASYRGRVEAALRSPAGQRAELINVTSRENDLFDWLYERIIAPTGPGDRAMGQGLDLPNAVTLQLDCPETLDHLARMGMPVGRDSRRICHWSAYTRPGVMAFYGMLLRRPDLYPLVRLAAGLPEAPDPRWSRLLPRPRLTPALPFLKNPG